MQFLDNLFDQNAYSLDKLAKLKFFKKNLNVLTLLHFKKSSLYKNYLNGIKL